MPLDPLQEEVARVALHLAEAGHVALAGGGAMLAHEFVDRPTMDLDLFTSDPGEVGPITDALHEALHQRGYAVEVTRREDTFSHLQVTGPDGRRVDVDLAQDARMLPAVQLAVGAVLHPAEEVPVVQLPTRPSEQVTVTVRTVTEEQNVTGSLDREQTALTSRVAGEDAFVEGDL